MNADTLERFDRCRRLVAWDSQYLNLRISPIRALYLALASGLTGDEKAAENRIMELAAQPGIDVEGDDQYALAKHYAALATILTTYLRATDAAWVPIPAEAGWNTDCYDAGKELRRIVLVDRWNDVRKMSEIRSWRTVAETSKFNKPMLLNFLVIGASHESRRISPWSRTLAHPRSKQIRFAKKSHKSDGFAESWTPVWRENWEGPILDWLGAMQSDGVFADLVHSIRVPVSPRRDEILKDILRIEREIGSLPANPPMTRSACYGFSPCRYVDVCHSPKGGTPADHGWVSISGLTNNSLQVA
jgi:hypothetical protein